MRTLLTTTIATLAGVVLCLSACGASAQPRPSTARDLAQGLALESVLAQTGLSLIDVIVPAEDADPVRLELGDGNGISALLDVRVLPDARSAGERLVAIAPALSSHGASAVTGLGDLAVADDAGTIVAMARGNVLVVVRSVSRDGGAALDARALARQVVLACDASPRLPANGSPRSTIAVPAVALQAGTETSVPMPRGAIAMRVTVDGDGIARREESGWRVSRGSGALEAHVIAVDALLRVAR